MHTRRVYSKASDAKTPLSLVNRPARPGKNAPTSLPNVHYLCYGVILLQYFCGELPFECLYDLSRWNFLSDMQWNSINSAIETNDKSIDILRVKYGGHGPNCCSRTAFVGQYLAVLVCGC